jgi:DHA3 family macrolide efflux protein-like MFS transporter
MENPPPEKKPIRQFLILWAGQAVSLMGSQLVQFALVWWLTITTGSATVLSLATLAAILPQILLGPFAGTVVDRGSRRLIMIFADGFIAAATLFLALMFWLQLASPWVVCAILMARSAGAAFHWPAMQASTTLMVPKQHLARIGGLNQLLSGAAAVIVPPLGALAMTALPMQVILAIDVVTALPAIIPLLFIAVPQPPPRPGADTPGGKRTGLWADLREGWHYITGWRALLMLVVIGVLINMVGQAAGAMLPLLVMKHFQGGARELGWWEAALGFGAILGGLVLSLWGGFRRKVVTQMVALTLDGIVLMTIGLAAPQYFPFTVAAVFVVGFLEAFVLGVGGAIAQALIPPDLQGRVLSLISSLTQGLSPFGLLLAGPFADAFGVQTWWVIAAVFISIMGIVALSIPSIAHIEDAVPPDRSPKPVEPAA